MSLDFIWCYLIAKHGLHLMSIDFIWWRHLNVKITFVVPRPVEHQRGTLFSPWSPFSVRPSILLSAGLNTNFLAHLPDSRSAGNFTCPAIGKFNNVPALTSVLPGWTDRAALNVQPHQTVRIWNKNINLSYTDFCKWFPDTWLQVGSLYALASWLTGWSLTSQQHQVGCGAISKHLDWFWHKDLQGVHPAFDIWKEWPMWTLYI